MNTRTAAAAAAIALVVALVVISPEPRPVDADGATSWEYRVISRLELIPIDEATALVTEGLDAVNKAKTKEEKNLAVRDAKRRESALLAEKLAPIGADGWQLCDTMLGEFYIFKRPVR